MLLRVWRGGFVPLRIAKETKSELDQLLPVLPKNATPEDYSELLETLIHYWEDTSPDWRAVERRKAWRKSSTDQKIVAELVKERSRNVQREFKRSNQEYKLVGNLTHQQAESLVESAQKVIEAKEILHTLEHKVLPKILPDFGGDFGYFAGLDALKTSELLEVSPEVYDALYRTKSVRGGHVFVSILKDGSVYVENRDKKKWIKELPALKKKYARFYSDLRIFKLSDKKLQNGAIVRRVRVDVVPQQFTWLPRKTLIRAGIEPARKEKFDLDGSIVSRDVAEARIQVAGGRKSVISLVVFCKPGDKKAIGHTVLNSLGLGVNHEKRVLEHEPIHESVRSY
jgi:predicted aspartyl protease